MFHTKSQKLNVATSFSRSFPAPPTSQGTGAGNEVVNVTRNKPITLNGQRSLSQGKQLQPHEGKIWQSTKLSIQEEKREIGEQPGLQLRQGQKTKASLSGD